MPDRRKSTPEPETISRYRLWLVRDAKEPRGLPSHCKRPVEAARLLHRLVRNEPSEVMGALFLDSKREIIGYSVPYRGVIDRALVEPRGIFAPALLANAISVIVFHTHPSGNTVPSKEDIATTERLIQAGEILGINILDHLILGDPPSFLSLFSSGRLGAMVSMIRRKAKPKYRNPRTGETWAGRGFMANWLKRELEAGASLDDFKIPR